MPSSARIERVYAAQISYPEYFFQATINFCHGRQRHLITDRICQRYEAVFISKYVKTPRSGEQANGRSQDADALSASLVSPVLDAWAVVGDNRSRAKCHFGRSDSLPAHSAAEVSQTVTTRLQHSTTRPGAQVDSFSQLRGPDVVLEIPTSMTGAVHKEDDTIPFVLLAPQSSVVFTRRPTSLGLLL